MPFKFRSSPFRTSQRHVNESGSFQVLQKDVHVADLIQFNVCLFTVPSILTTLSFRETKEEGIIHVVRNTMHATTVTALRSILSTRRDSNVSKKEKVGIRKP